MGKRRWEKERVSDFPKVILLVKDRTRRKTKGFFHPRLSPRSVSSAGINSLPSHLQRNGKASRRHRSASVLVPWKGVSKGHSLISVPWKLGLSILSGFMPPWPLKPWIRKIQLHSKNGSWEWIQKGEARNQGGIANQPVSPHLPTEGRYRQRDPKRRLRASSVYFTLPAATKHLIVSLST